MPGSPYIVVPMAAARPYMGWRSTRMDLHHSYWRGHLDGAARPVGL